MSRTFRNISKQMAKRYNKKKVRDGTPTRFDKSCQNHGDCPICKGNRLYKNLKRLNFFIAKGANKEIYEFEPLTKEQIKILGLE